MKAKVVSVFDGMACGMISMIMSGVEVEEYVAFEVDKYATKTSSHNFPMIRQEGDVFQADFTKYNGYDFLIGGSPCTYWSIAQTKNRETVASGMGWELFQQYVRALQEINPKYFIYENNKSMSPAIRESITRSFGFEPVCINSALVSAQNRQRLYWVGIRNDDGSYRKANVEQPEDLGIFLTDILDENYNVLSEGEMDYMVRSTNGKYSDRWSYLQKPSQNDKGLCITANVSKGVPYNLVAEPINITEDGKAQVLKANYYKSSVANFFNGEVEANGTDKSNALTTVQKDNMVAEPVLAQIKVGALPRPNGELSKGQAFQIYSQEGKSVTLCANGGGAGGKTGLYAIRVDDSKEQKFPVYEVANGMITVKEKQYPIKLMDGLYIIRKLTVSECMRLQTVPSWYEFPVSNTQAYKMLGNGWTCNVIVHLINSIFADDISNN